MIGYELAKSQKGLRVQLENLRKDNPNYLTKKQRRRKKYSNSFNEIFLFFLKSYRCGILTFCGSEINVDFDINGEEGKYCFRSFENGEYKYVIPKTRHPNILRGVIVGKKSWGLFVKETTDGISEMLFTKQEILDQFKYFGIDIPQRLLDDFNNTLYKKWWNKYKSGNYFK